MLLRYTAGNENFPNVGQSKLHLFFAPSFDVPGKEMHLSMLAKGGIPGVVVNQQGQPTHVSAAEGMKPELFGKWTSGVLDLPEGLCFKVFGQRQPSGQQPLAATIFARVRSSAAFQRITFGTMAWGRGKFAAVTVEGRFDILDAAERRERGVQVAPAYERFATPAVVNRVFTLSQIAAETAPKSRIEQEVVTNSAGVEVMVPVRRNQRALDL